MSVLLSTLLVALLIHSTICANYESSNKVIPLGEVIGMPGHDYAGGSPAAGSDNGGAGNGMSNEQSNGQPEDGASQFDTGGNIAQSSVKYLGQSCTSHKVCSSGACIYGKCCYHEGLFQKFSISPKISELI